MLLEALIISMCIGKYECDNTLKAYWAGHKDLQERAAYWQRRGEKLVGEDKVVLYLVPIAAGAVQKSVSIPLGPHFSIKATSTDKSLIFKFAY